MLLLHFMTKLFILHYQKILVILLVKLVVVSFSTDVLLYTDPVATAADKAKENLDNSSDLDFASGTSTDIFIGAKDILSRQHDGMCQV